jgi:hypothetical protein
MDDYMQSFVSDFHEDMRMKNEIKTLDVPSAGKKYFGLSRGGSYAAAQRGDIPTIRIGRKIRVPVVALERMLADAKPRQEGAA